LSLSLFLSAQVIVELAHSPFYVNTMTLLEECFTDRELTPGTF